MLHLVVIISVIFDWIILINQIICLQNMLYPQNSKPYLCVAYYVTENALCLKLVWPLISLLMSLYECRFHHVSKQSVLPFQFCLIFYTYFHGKVHLGRLCHVKDMEYVSLCPSEMIKITLPLFCGGTKIPQAVPHGIWDFTSLTRDWTEALGSESTES